MASKPMGPELLTGVGVAATRRGRAAARELVENCIMTRAVQISPDYKFQKWTDEWDSGAEKAKERRRDLRKR